MQDFTGVPAVVDLAAMRDAMARAGRRPGEDQPARPGRARDRPLGAGRRVRHARRLPRQRRARVRAQPGALRVPALGPGRVRRLHGRAAGHRASCTRSTSSTSRASSSSTTKTGQAYPDTLVGTDSHTTMVNGLGVLGWGVGGIEAEAAMLGQPMSMLIPQVLGFQLHGELPEGATATDLVLTVTEMLRERGVVGKFVEFYGAGARRPAARRPRDDRQHVARVRLDLRDLPDRRRDAALPAVHRPPAASRSRSSRPTPRSRACGTTSTPRSRPSPTTLELDLGDRRAEPRRPQAPAGPRLAEPSRKRSSAGARATTSRATATRPTRRTRPSPSRTPPRTRLPTSPGTSRPSASPSRSCRRRATATLPHNGTARRVTVDGETFELDHGHVVIAAITSCTNTSNPSVMLGAGLLARNARGARAEQQAVGQDLARARARRS